MCESVDRRLSTILCISICANLRTLDELDLPGENKFTIHLWNHIPSSASRRLPTCSLQHGIRHGLLFFRVRDG